MADKMSGVSKYFKPSYNSDEDLDEETQRKIQQAGENSTQADELRKKSWNSAGAYPKLKRMVKGAWGGDKHE